MPALNLKAQARSPRTKHALVRFILRESLEAFIERSFNTLDPSSEFVPSAFIGVVADELERVHHGDTLRLVLNLPPRHLKSIIASRAFVAWALGQKPALRFVLVSYGEDLSSKNLRAVRAILESNFYRQLFPRTAISKAKNTATEFETSVGGGVIATTIEGALTGRGGDIIVVDDPIKAMDVYSDTKRATVNEWLSRTGLSRLDNKATGRIILVMQRLHVDDMTGHVMQRGGWRHCSLPAIAVEHERIVYGANKIFERQPGDALFPEREPLDVLQRMREEMGSFTFGAQYQQQPVPPEGNLLKPEWLVFLDEFPPPASNEQIVQSWDTGIKDGDANDWSACVTARQIGADYYITDITRYRVTFPDLKARAIELAQRHRPERILIEDAANGSALLEEMRRSTKFNLISVTPHGSKMQRIIAQSPKLEGRRVFLPKSAPWLDAFLSEYKAFPRGTHDDQLDALAQLLGYDTEMIPADALVCVGGRGTPHPWALAG